MKIAILANDSNGLYLFRRHLISELIRNGNEVIALTPFGTELEELEKLGISLIETPMERRGTNPFKDFSLLRKYHRELKRINPDLVVTYTIKPNVYGGIACRLLNIPYGINVTGMGTAFESDGILKKIAVFLNRIALKKAKVVFFENNADRDTFVDEGIVSKEITHVLNGAGVDLDYFYYQEYPRNEVFRFLFIGRVMKEKGIGELLDAVFMLRNNGINCILDILGEYEEDYSDILKSAEKEGLIEYHGFQSDVRPFIKKCDCFVLPSYHEGMANTNIENASSGRPVITTNIPGCKEAVIDSCSGFLCEPKSVKSLYDAMLKVVSISRDEREKMGVAGRKHAEEVFDKKKVVKQTISKLL